MGLTSTWSPLGNFMEGQAHPNVFAFLQFLSNRGLSIFCVFYVYFPIVQGFSPRLLCLFSNSCQFKFFIYSLYIYIYIIFKAAPWDDVNFRFQFCTEVVYPTDQVFIIFRIFTNIFNQHFYETRSNPNKLFVYLKDD